MCFLFLFMALKLEIKAPLSIEQLFKLIYWCKPFTWFFFTMNIEICLESSNQFCKRQMGYCIQCQCAVLERIFPNVKLVFINFKRSLCCLSNFSDVWCVYAIVEGSQWLYKWIGEIEHVPQPLLLNDFGFQKSCLATFEHMLRCLWTLIKLVQNSAVRKCHYDAYSTFS